MKKDKYIISDNYVAFHGSFLSNWYPCRIEYKEMVFHCSEQLYMWFKAKFFRDEETAEKILQCSTAAESKDLGRQVKNFDEANWTERSYGYMVYCVYLKFKQNLDLRKEFLELGKGRHFVEGSPYDKIWGVGIDYRDIRIQNRDNWQGQNRLGQALDYVYKELKDDKMIIELI